MTALAVTREYDSKGAWLADLVADMSAATAVIDIQNSGDLILAIKNGSGGSVVATLVSVADPYGRTSNVVNTIADGKIGLFFFAAPAMFNNAGVAQVTLDVITSVTCALYRVRKST